MSFAAQLAARAEATTKRTSSSGGSSIGSPPQPQSISESIKNRVSASSTEQYLLLINNHLHQHQDGNQSNRIRINKRRKRIRRNWYQYHPKHRL